MKLIDTHVHIFPDNLAERALKKLGTAAKILPSTDGTFSGTKKKTEEWGISEIWMQSVVTNLHQMRAVNDFAVSLRSEFLVPFCSVYPHDVEESLAELERVKSLGVRGIKLHPEYQQFEAADEKFFPLYEYMERNGMALLFHSGRDSAYEETHYASPKSMLTVYQNFPKLKIICAHLGGWMDWDDVLRYTAGTDMYFDTATIGGYISESVLKAIFKKHPVERILFATDAPWSEPEREMKLIRSIGLSSQDMEKVCHQNAEQLKSEIGLN